LQKEKGKTRRLLVAIRFVGLGFSKIENIWRGEIMKNYFIGFLILHVNFLAQI